MASVLVRQAGLSVLKNSRVPTFSGFYANGFGEALSQYRTVVYSASGGILPKPKKTSFGLFRIAVVVIPFLYVGTLISKNFAALLEEHDIFVPEDDDDDD
ncbi:single-pass membrane protein with aspartate-rich tail 1b [Salvelinus namaycush]|uniref:Essential MCU regulator, mitochondrial n=2 Tax=Salmoninae TaxID=504568 RepID=A0A8U0Q3Y1_SALNM|nr:single-pass membrane protein with aspartate-rich tail 1b [Salmo salar]XP_038836593.1 single-pass membrane protein with aspartate-rich tail 1b [Salvelinus namaycush]|eukprot:XP_014059188.1 PREDICTED: essential MCU regulator, mitochondrial [Salmo salar]